MRFFDGHQKNQRKPVAALALLLAVLMALPIVISVIPGSADAVTQAEIDALKKDSAALAQEKKNLSNQLAKLEGEINSALSKKLVVEQEINVVTEQIATTQALIVKYDELIAQEEVNLAEAQEREAQHYDDACQRVRMMEEQGTVTYWQILFNAADFNDLLDRAMMINETVEYDNAVMDALEQARKDVEEAKASLESARAEQLEAKASLDAQKAELDAKKATVNTLLKELEAKQDIYESQIDELDSQIDVLGDEINAKMKEYQAQIEAALRAQANANTNTGSSYIWPLSGRYTLSSLYGNRTDPFTGQPANHGGIDIPAPYGTPICAAKGGVVITSGYHSAYGNYVVVGHDNGYSTLYAHMSSRSVSVGQVVSQGQELGKVGSTGRSTGNHLHFELRLNNVRQDPISLYPNLTLYYSSKGQTVVLDH